jgi:hypothetical protein
MFHGIKLHSQDSIDLEAAPGAWYVANFLEWRIKNYRGVFESRKGAV